MFAKIFHSLFAGVGVGVGDWTTGSDDVGVGEWIIRSDDVGVGD